MAKNCINYYYRCRHIYEAFRASYKAFWIKYTTPLIAYLDKYLSNATGFLSWRTIKIFSVFEILSAFAGVPYLFCKPKLSLATAAA
jgi:hypothetical protein